MRLSRLLSDINSALADKAYETESNVLGGGLKQVVDADVVESIAEDLSIIEEMTDDYHEED